jgi:hypothetical protein
VTVKSPEATAGRTADYRSRLRSACPGLRVPAAQRKQPSTHLIDILTERGDMSTTADGQEMTVEAALARLRQYQERTPSTWSTATYESGSEKALHDIARTLAEAVRNHPTRKDMLDEIVDRLARRATLYGDSETVRQVMIDLKALAEKSGAGQ